MEVGSEGRRDLGSLKEDGNTHLRNTQSLKSYMPGMPGMSALRWYWRYTLQKFTQIGRRIGVHGLFFIYQLQSSHNRASGNQRTNIQKPQLQQRRHQTFPFLLQEHSSTKTSPLSTTVMLHFHSSLILFLQVALHFRDIHYLGARFMPRSIKGLRICLPSS